MQPLKNSSRDGGDGFRGQRHTFYDTDNFSDRIAAQTTATLIRFSSLFMFTIDIVAYHENHAFSRVGWTNSVVCDPLSHAFIQFVIPSLKVIIAETSNVD